MKRKTLSNLIKRPGLTYAPVCVYWDRIIKLIHNKYYYFEALKNIVFLKELVEVSSESFIR